ncbi:MAG: hypothetical protein LH481_03685 [Burkholderiales bacterium]|nr:hypothetical protein [Burkholderiales bacterium]
MPNASTIRHAIGFCSFATVALPSGCTGMTTTPDALKRHAIERAMVAPASR